MAYRLFLYCFWGTLLVKAGIAYFFPITGDEAFFYQWGVYPALVYSDHPPMVGWMLAWLRTIGDSPFILRSITVLMSNVIALLMVDSLRTLLPKEKQSLAWLGAAIYLLLPWSWMPMLVTTDTPLIYFVMLAGWAYIRADQQSKATSAWYLLCGLFLALAFLSKYFAALLGFACVAHILIKKPVRWRAIVLLAIPVAPVVMAYLYVNALNGWPNIMFNFFNRNETAVWSIRTPALYLAMMVYLLTPWLLFFGLKSVKDKTQQSYAGLGLLCGVPFALFLVLSLKKTIGLHWVLSFIPFFVIWVSVMASEQQLKKSLNWTLLLAVPHALLIAALIWMPLSFFQNKQWHERLVFLRHSKEIAVDLKPPKEAQLMAKAYSPASVLSYHAGQYLPVFGAGKFHARQDDQIVDFAKFKGKDIRIFEGIQPPDVSQYKPYFESVSASSITNHGVTYFYVDGQSFKYDVYKAQVLRTIANQYHRIPSWLPILGNPFCERYGFADCSPASR